MKIRNFALVICIAALAEANSLSAKNLYVSTTGNDDVTYADNSIVTPWATPERAFTSVAPGDSVFFRAGTYGITGTIDTRYNENPETSSDRVVFRSYFSESVLFDAGSNNGRINIDRDYYEVNEIEFSNAATFWHVGGTLSSIGFTLKNCKGRLTAFGGPDAYGCVAFMGTTADSSRVENCNFFGPGPGNINTAGVIIFKTQNIKVLNCEYYDFPNGVYYKHPNAPGDDTGIEFAYNYFMNCQIGIRISANYPSIHNNLFVNGIGILSGGQAGGGDDPDNPSGGWNNIYRNTFVNAGLDIMSSCIFTTLENNIFTAGVGFFQYANTNHYTTMDYNLYPTGTAVMCDETHYTLAQWQTFYGQSVNSIAGAPLFVDGASYDNISRYALDPTSPGYQAGNDGEDMGANVSLIGRQPRAPFFIRLDKHGRTRGR